MFRKSLVVMALMSLFAGSAFAGTRVWLVGDGNLMNTSTTASGITVNTTGKFGYGGGLMFSFGMGKSAEFNLGGIYQRRSFEFNGATTNVPYINIPATFSFWLSPAMALDIGGYYAMGMGNLTDGSGNSASFDTAGFNKADYGARGGVKFMLGRRISVGAAYIMGLKEVFTAPTAGAETKWKGFDFNLGIALGGAK